MTNNVFENEIKSYDSEWKTLECREFSAGEKAAIKELVVVPSNFGKSVCFLLHNFQKSFIPLEPNAELYPADTPNINELRLVELEYIGSDTNVKTRKCIKVRYIPVSNKAEQPTFDNPFGI